MAKLPIFNQTYIPSDVEFVDETDGEIKKNSEIPFPKQVKTELKYADNAEQQIYNKSLVHVIDKNTDDMAFESISDYSCLKKHVLKIENLTDENDKPILNGVDLVKCKNPFLNNFKTDLFLRINGYRADQNKPDNGQGEFTQGEEKASA